MPDNKGLTDGEVLRGVRDLVSKGKIKWTYHVEVQMADRRLDRGQVKECLLKGNFVERPVKPNRPGPIEYAFRMRANVDGEQIDVAASLQPETHVVVITVFDPNKWS